MRLIDADALMKEFATFVRASNQSDFADIPTWNDAVSLVGSAPTIEERKKGEWLEAHSNDPCWYVCDKCGRRTDIRENYCPNCGARMEEEKNNGK